MTRPKIQSRTNLDIKILFPLRETRFPNILVQVLLVAKQIHIRAQQRWLDRNLNRCRSEKRNQELTLTRKLRNQLLQRDPCRRAPVNRVCPIIYRHFSTPFTTTTHGPATGSSPPDHPPASLPAVGPARSIPSLPPASGSTAPQFAPSATMGP